MPIFRELITLSSELVAAVQEHDRGRLEQLLAAEFTLNGAAGELDREAFLEAASGPYEIDEFAYEEIDPEIYGDTAVLVSRYRQTARLDGRDLSHRHARDGHLGAARRPLADRAPPRHDRRPLSRTTDQSVAGARISRSPGSRPLRLERSRLLALEAHPVAVRRPAGAQRGGHHRDAADRADGRVVVHVEE